MEYKFNIDQPGTARKRYVWSLKGDKGGVHIWAQFSDVLTAYGEKCYGGVEFHYPKPPYDHSPHKAPIEDCWLLNGPCWCDGSSLVFSEKLRPMVEAYEDEPEKLTPFMNGELFDWYNSHIARTED